MWISAKSSKGEGAHTTPIKVTTAQYGKYLSKDMSVSPKAQSQTTSRKKLASVMKVPLRENRIKIYTNTPCIKSTYLCIPKLLLKKIKMRFAKKSKLK